MKRPIRSFRTMVLLRTVMVLTVMLVLCGVATAIVVTREVRTAGRNQALQRAEAAAPVTVFALLVGRADPEEARRAAHALVVGEVLASELWIVDPKSKVASAGPASGALSGCLKQAWPNESNPVLIQEIDNGWCVFRAVSTLNVTENDPAQVGAVKLLVSSAWAKQLRANVLVTNAAIWALVFLAAAWLAIHGATRAMRPLTALADAMRKAAEEGSDVRAPLRGAKEIAVMGRAFNGLMDRLAEEARHLESKVVDRTQELRHAHDLAQSAERYTSALMAGISHEMRTPLHVIQGYAGLARGELEFVEDAEAAKTYMKTVQTESIQLLERVDELLRYSGSEAGSLSITNEACSLAQVADAVRHRCETIACAHGNLLLVIGKEVCVTSDRQLLTQIASNLATNACKFTRQGSVRVVLDYTDGAVRIDVTDDGPGFNRGAGTAARSETDAGGSGVKRFNGMGLGLTIVTRFVELLGGNLQLESAPGQGTRARVRVPCALIELREPHAL